MENRKLCFVLACLAGFGLFCGAVQGDPNSGGPGYVFSVVNDYGWIDAGTSPAYMDYSYAYSNLEETTTYKWLANGGSGTAELTYRFAAPEGKFIDAIQFGIRGWIYDSNHNITVYANNIALGSVNSGGDYYLDASAELDIPASQVDLKLVLKNNWDPLPYDLTRIYSTWQATGNDYHMACHVMDETPVDYTVEVDETGAIYEQGPVEDFANWAYYRFKAPGTMPTHDIGYPVTSPTSPSKTGTISIPFKLPEGMVYDTARLDYGSQMYGYGSNNGYVKLEVLTEDGSTQIYYHQSPDTDQSSSMNYTPEGGVPNAGNGYYRVYTDIDDLVAGKNAFQLTITAMTGWSSWLYNGGVFLPGRWDLANDGSDFYLTGSAVEDPCAGISDADTFEIRGPVSDFADWAKDTFGATGSMETFRYGSTWYSGSPNPSTTASLTIPFHFRRPLADARLDYGSQLNGYGSNPGYVKVELQTEDGTTQIYYHQSPDTSGQPASMNYTPEGGVPNQGNGSYRVYTDIDDLVAGKTQFTLTITSLTGWSSYIYNGGQFLPASWGLIGDSDFVLSGHVVEGPAQCGDPYTSYLAADIAGPNGQADCRVDLFDFALMSNQWLECTDPGDAGCTQHWQW